MNSLSVSVGLTLVCRQGVGQEAAPYWSLPLSLTPGPYLGTCYLPEGPSSWCKGQTGGGGARPLLIALWAVSFCFTVQALVHREQ